MSKSLAESTAYLVAKYGTPLIRANGDTIKARVDEKADSIQRTFPKAFDDYASSGRIAVLRFDGSDAAQTIRQFEVVTDSRSKIQWRIEQIQEDSDGATLLSRACLVVISPM